MNPPRCPSAPSAVNSTTRGMPNLEVMLCKGCDWPDHLSASCPLPEASASWLWRRHRGYAEQVHHTLDCAVSKVPAAATSSTMLTQPRTVQMMTMKQCMPRRVAVMARCCNILLAPVLRLRMPSVLRRRTSRHVQGSPGRVGEWGIKDAETTMAMGTLQLSMLERHFDSAAVMVTSSTTKPLLPILRNVVRRSTILNHRFSARS